MNYHAALLLLSFTGALTDDTGDGGEMAKCRVLTSTWSGADANDTRRGGYSYKKALGETTYRIDQAPERQLGAQHSGCELQAYRHDQLNRSFVLAADQPFLILGATDEWAALDKWQRERLLADHGESIFHAGLTGEKTLRSLLNTSGYHVGQMNLLHDRYSEGAPWPENECPGNPNCEYFQKHFGRQYSPMLQTLSADYQLPDFLLPMRVLQIGLGGRQGSGVRPEEHPSAWWANLRGIKRWVFHPPSHSEVPELLNVRPSCALPTRSTTSTVCDQPVGSILWVPNGWWHETCNLDDFSAGIGGITYEGANELPSGKASAATLELLEKISSEYTLDQIPYCHKQACTSLPSVSHA